MGCANKQAKQCAGCAFRPGGAANRELYNHLRATICMLGPLPFLCHDGRDWADPDNHKFTPGEMFRRGWSICQGWRREVARLAATGYYANNTEATRSFAKACGYRKCHPRASSRNFTRSMGSTSTRLSSIRTIALLIL